MASAQQTKPRAAKKPKKVPAAAPVPLKDSLAADTLRPLLTEDNEPDTLIDPVDTLEMRRSKSALKSKVKYYARDSIVYRAEEKSVFLYGDAKVYYEDLTLFSDFIRIELEKNLIHSSGTADSSGRVTGSPIFKQGTEEFKAQRISYNYKTKRGYLSEFKTKKDEGYIHGTHVRKNEENELTVQDAYYTTCDQEVPHYHINATKLKMIPDKKVVAKWPNLFVEGVNTPLALPFGIFPIQKGQTSGVVIPNYGSSNDRGFFLRNGGYYFGLGDHADLMMTGDLYANLSWASNSLFRYANRYRYNGTVTFNFANNSFGLPEDPGYNEQQDFRFTWTHSQDPKARPGTNFSANVNLVSNEYLALNSYNTQNIVANQMQSSINYNKSMGGGKYNLSANASVSQALLPRDITIQFPNLTFTVSSFTPFKSKYKPVADKWYENISTSYQTQFRNQITTKDSTLFRSRSWNEFTSFYDSTGQYGMLHSIPVQTNFKLFKFYALSVRADMNEYWYWQTVRKDTANGTVNTRTVSGFDRAFTIVPRADVSTKYYGLKNFSGKLQAVRHVVTPSVGFSYSPDYSGKEWNYYRSYYNSRGEEIRYSIFERGIFGSPQPGRQGNVNFSVDNNLEMKMKRGKDTAEKVDKVQIFETFRVAGFYNLFADSLNLSVINISARTTLFKVIRVNADADLDPYVNEVSYLRDPYSNSTYDQNPFATGTRYARVDRVNRFYLSENGSLGVINNAQLGFSFSFNRDLFRTKKSDRPGMAGELKYINDFPQDYADFSIPWSLTFNYTVRYDRVAPIRNPDVSAYIQTLNFNGDFNLTKKWKIGYSSGYDLKTAQITYTSIDIIRDLHCWEFKFNWIPFGPRQSFLFNINVKASILQELKMTRRKDWYDRTI